MVKFGLPSLPVGSTIESVTLHVYVSDVAIQNLTSKPLQIHRITSSWTESGVTWDPKPALFLMRNNSGGGDNAQRIDAGEILTFTGGTVTYRLGNASPRDGLDDRWEREHFGSITISGGAPNDDQDRDGYLDRNEFIAGTDPGDPGSACRMLYDGRRPQSIVSGSAGPTHRSKLLTRR